MLCLYPQLKEMGFKAPVPIPIPTHLPLTLSLQNGQESQNFDTGCENFKSNRKRDYIANNTYELIILFVFSDTPSSSNFDP